MTPPYLLMVQQSPVAIIRTYVDHAALCRNLRRKSLGFPRNPPLQPRPAAEDRDHRGGRPAGHRRSSGDEHHSVDARPWPGVHDGGRHGSLLLLLVRLFDHGSVGAAEALEAALAAGDARSTCVVRAAAL